MKTLFFFKCITFFSFLLASIFASELEDTLQNQIYAHLLIRDYTSACEEGSQAISKYPTSLPLWDAYMNALAQAGAEQELMSAWKEYEKLNKDAYGNRKVLEQIAWGIIAKSCQSQSPLIRAMGVLGAYFGNDSKGINLICRHLEDNNSLVRCYAVRLASKFKDSKLLKAVWDNFKRETVWKVKLESIKAVGAMKIKAAKNELLKIIADSGTTAEEKAAATESLITLLEEIDGKELHNLANSKRAALRALACQLVTHYGSKQHLDYIFPLLSDNSSEVRAAALMALGVFNLAVQDELRKFEHLLFDPNPTVAIVAAWALMPLEFQKSLVKLKQWITHDSQQVRLLAAAALGGSGPKAASVMEEVLKQSKDPYVHLNLGLNLISYRHQTTTAAESVYRSFMNISERWMWKKKGIFRYIAPSELTFDDPTIEEDPQTADQLVRLEVLNTLAIVKYPKAKEAIIKFLKQKTWGVTSIASALLLMEGDSETIDLVKELLDHPHQKIKIQAALILSLWSREEAPLKILHETYESANRETKERIIEGLGHIGSVASLPLLCKALNEPAQSMRIITAAALLKCLYY